MEPHQSSQGRLQFRPGNDEIDEAVVLQVFGGLESIGQFFAQGLFNHPAAGKADQGLGFGQDEVAEHGKAGRDAAGGGVGEQGDIKQFGLAVAL